MPYQAPIADYKFIFDHVVRFDQVANTAKFKEATPDMVDAILGEAGRMCQDVLAPLQRVGCLLYTSPSPRDRG